MSTTIFLDGLLCNICLNPPKIDIVNDYLPGWVACQQRCRTLVNDYLPVGLVNDHLSGGVSGRWL